MNCLLPRLPMLATLLALSGTPAAAADEASAYPAPPLAQRFIDAATQRALCASVEGVRAELADTLWSNESCTVWTVQLSADAGLTAFAVASRLRQSLRSPVARILFRHLLGLGATAAPATDDAAAAGILPLDHRRLRFLLTRPDADFPRRLSAPEATLCVDPWHGDDAGCGPYRLPTHFGFAPTGVVRAASGSVFPECWRLSTPPPEEGSQPLMKVTGVVGDVADAGAHAAAPRECVRLSFWLPPLPAYCDTEREHPPTVRSGLLAHLFVEIAPARRGDSARLRAALERAALLPRAGRWGWIAQGRLLPGPLRELATEPAVAPAAAFGQPTDPGDAAARTLRLLYPQEMAALRCLAERIRATLMPAGWEVQIFPADWESLRAARRSGDYDAMLHLAVTDREAGAAEMLRLLAPWISTQDLAAAGGMADGTADEAEDLRAEEWRIAEQIEARLLSGGILIPLLIAPIGWRLEAPTRPRGLRGGILPQWQELPPSCVVISLGAPKRARDLLGEDDEP